MKYSTKILKNELTLRQEKNPNYSLRSFALFLNISPASLSSILNEKRTIPLKKIDSIAKKLKLDRAKTVLFKNCASSGKIKPTSLKLIDKQITRVQIDEKLHFKIIAEWEYYALLSLLELENFRPNENWISDKLCISNKRTHEIVKNLKKAKMITIDEDGFLYRSSPSYKTSEDVISQALRTSHKNSLKQAEEKLSELPLLLRDFSSITLAGSMTQLNEAKTLIRDFHSKLEQIFQQENQTKTEVIQCNIQLYPITKVGI